jgi:hypothetical protein
MTAAGPRSPAQSHTEARTVDIDAMQIVLLYEADRLVHRAGQRTADRQSVDQMHLVESGKSSGLNSGIGKLPFAFEPEQQHAADGGNLMPLVLSTWLRMRCNVKPRHAPSENAGLASTGRCLLPHQGSRDRSRGQRQTVQSCIDIQKII